MRGMRGARPSLVAAAWVLYALSAHAQASEVTFAGVAFLGSDATVGTRFPHAEAYERELRNRGDSGYRHILAALRQAPPQHLAITTQPIAELKGHDQAIVTELVVTSETVSTERFGDIRKLFILERAQALFFDFKSMTVLRSYPLSFAYIDNFRHEPTEDEIRERVQMVFEGAGGKPGLYGRYAAVLARATVPAQAPRLLQVKHVAFDAGVVAQLPAYLKASNADYEAWAADMAAEAISSRFGVPIVPFTQDAAQGRMMLHGVQDSDVMNLKLPTPDYEISLHLTGMKKVKLTETGAGASWAYGVLGRVQIVEPLTNTVYLGTALKNAEVKVVPASQSYVDDFAAYDDTMHGMFAKLASAVAGKDLKWAKAAAGAPDIEAQLTKTMDLINQCK
jgi:hypothetical protein